MTGRRLRIAYVINSMEGGGAASPIPDIVRVFRAYGAEARVFALTPRNRKSLPAIEAMGQEVHVREGGETDHLVAYRWLKREVRQYGPTHIWTSLTRATLIGQIVGRRLGLPVVSWQHNAFLKDWNLRLLRWSKHLSCLWVADSSLVADLTCERLDLPRNLVVTWPIFSAHASAPVADHADIQSHLRFCTLGRLHPAKGYDILVDAMARLKDTHPPDSWSVTVGGTGTDAEPLRQKAQDLGVSNIEFVGFVDDPELFLAAHHAYLQPSRREGFCIAAHQAMLAGLPAIVSDTGQMAISAQSCGGGCVPVGSSGALADAMSDWIAHRSQIAEKGAKARAYILNEYGEARFQEIGFSILDRLALGQQG
jgi:glycosyltransferase involved in cell wall biosynthesis